MAFYDEEHKNKIEKLEKLWAGFNDFNELAKTLGINDIFQDNNGKIVQQLIYMNFENLPGREGNDAKDENGTEWEMKSANENLVIGFSTHHHLNFDILEKYKKVPWLFSIYDDITLKEIYVLTPSMLNPMFEKWKNNLTGSEDDKEIKKIPAKKSLNNPKIPIKFVRDNGIKVYPFADKPVNPADIIKSEEIN